MLSQKQMTEIYPLLNRAESAESNLNDYEKGVVRILKRRQKYYTRIPPSLLDRENQLAAEASVVWRVARKRSDFKAFQPYLEKSIELKREEAEKLGYEHHPYNALLDQFEEGITVDDVDRMYSRLIAALKNILNKIQKSDFAADSPLVKRSYDVGSMAEVNRKLVDVLGMTRFSRLLRRCSHFLEAETIESKLVLISCRRLV